MAWSWSTFTVELGRILDDAPSSNPAHSDSLRLDAVNAALREMMAYRPLNGKVLHSAVSSFALPADCYKIEAILETADDGSIALVDPGSIGDNSGYWVWANTVYLPETTDVTVYYQSYYPTVTAQTTDIAVPLWAREAVLCRAAAYCLVPNQASRARLGAYQDKQDANPLDNSLIQSSDWLINQFIRIMTEHKHAA